MLHLREQRVNRLEAVHGRVLHLDLELLSRRCNGWVGDRVIFLLIARLLFLEQLAVLLQQRKWTLAGESRSSNFND